MTKLMLVAALVLACAGQPQPRQQTPTLLVINSGLSVIVVHNEAGILGHVQPNEERCFRLLWSGWRRLAVSGIGGGWRHVGPRFNPSEREGWVWEIGIRPSADVRLNLVPGDRC